MSEVMPLIPLRGLTVFPNMVIHFDLGREKSILALERAMVMNQTIFLVSQKNADLDLPTTNDIYEYGTVAKIKQMLRLPGNNIRVLVDGQYRAKIGGYIQEVPYFLVTAEAVEEKSVKKTPHIAALMRNAQKLFHEWVSLHPKSSEEASSAVDEMQEPGRLADYIAANVELKVELAQQILETVDPELRLEKLNEILTRENEILKLEDNIKSKVNASMSKSQKEYYLREQIRVIHQELGESEDAEEEAAIWRKQLKDLNLG
ncbi:MAG: LON peptidase substrate-binding domain-containing protein, partial [Clostridia bacterium]|nr:LON peptidase substrate-binding domain-containing protein [Clostridia bacterium]